MEYIKCAAIRWKHKKDPDGVFRFMEGINHAQCLNSFSFMEISAKDRDMDQETEGFLTTEGRFVDRFEALEIAKAANQLNGYYNKNYLDSYAVRFYNYE